MLVVHLLCLFPLYPINISSSLNLPFSSRRTQLCGIIVASLDCLISRKPDHVKTVITARVLNFHWLRTRSIFRLLQSLACARGLGKLYLRQLTLRSLWFPLLMTWALLCDNLGLSAFCQQNFKTALTLKYLYGLSSLRIFGFGKLRSQFPKRTSAVKFAVYQFTSFLSL